MPLLELAALASGVGALFNLIGGINQPDPEAIYKKRMDDALKYLENVFGGFEMTAENRARQDMSQARRMGARQAAALGYTGDSAPFTSPAEASISARLQETLESLRNNKALSLANLKVEGVNFPIINKPNAYQYIGQLMSSGGDVLGTLAKGDVADNAVSESDRAFSTTRAQDPFRMNNAISGKAGQRPLDGSTNAIGALGAPVKGTNIASNFFTFGKPFRPANAQSPLFFSGGRNF